MKISPDRKLFLALGFFAAFAIGVSFLPQTAKSQNPASLSVSPTSGTFAVGSTFTISLFLNTNGEEVNAIEADLEFPPNKLQVVSPSTGKSLIGIWVTQPTYNNRTGSIKFQGAIPSPGINTSQGLISQITFRATGVGTAVLKFKDGSRVLLNDGKGTNILGQTTNGVYSLILPPPAGPTVVSQTHPDQEKWYPSRSVSLEWDAEEGIQGYSYSLSDEPVDSPENISEGTRSNVGYKNISDGIHYFHIKKLRNGVWGGTTHFGVKIDSTPPAEFPIEISPAAVTTTMKPAINFKTTDNLSGIDHYELKIVELKPGKIASAKEIPDDQNFFIEVEPPYIAELGYGAYDTIARAYDAAGNYTQSTKRLEIRTGVLNIVQGKGMRIRSNFIIPWLWIWTILVLALFLTGGFALTHSRAHRQAKLRLEANNLPETIKKQLEELKAFKEKYRGTAMMLFLGAAALISLFRTPAPTFAETKSAELSPPIIDVYSRNISNEEIFYVGGKTEAVQSEVLVYLQNLSSGETFTQSSASDKKGDWFYSHPTFLSTGKYLIWAQAKLGDLASPPSPQVEITVSPTALQIGASRLSYETIYLAALIVLSLAIAGMTLFGLYHRRHGKKKRAKLMEDIRRAEESIKRGFAVLHRDIQNELALVQRAKLSKDLSHEEKLLEEKILRDLQTVKNYIGKEIWELEKEI